jgi:DNA-binding GntR family transcriptional regulator
MARTKLYPSDRIPLYAQLAQHLRDRINSGEFSRDQRIPSKSDLREQYCVPGGEGETYLVSPRTVDTAIRLLKEEGILEPTPGKRMFIIPPGERNGHKFRRRSTDR